MHDLTQIERRRGRSEPPVERRTVRSGLLVGELEGPDLRYLRLGGLEIARRVSMAVRDRNWGTVPPELSAVTLEAGEDSFALGFQAVNRDRALGVDFVWRGEISGTSDGVLTLHLDGVANAATEFNRIGWCVLHPAENAGRRFRARTAGILVEGALPLEIGRQLFVDGSAVPVVGPFEQLEIEAADGVWARFAFDGAAFEVEDQRNWTDASFKTYSLSEGGPLPQRAEAGERIRQTVRISVAGVAPPAKGPSAPTIHLGSPCGRAPAIGVGAATHRKAMTAPAAKALRAARLAHVRVDIDTAAPDWPDRLGRAADEARTLDAALEVAVFVSSDPGALDQVAGALRAADIPIARVLAFDQSEPTSSTRTVEAVRRSFSAALGEVPVIGGTNIFFADLNRHRPDLGGVDGIAWPITATVHASDDTSVIETAATHGETVRAARAFSGDKTLHVTPVSFNARFNPHATVPLPEPGRGELPPQVDVRQPSLLAAAWTVASLHTLAESGVDSVTYFETTGWRGLVERADAPPWPDVFRSWPGMTFPVYHVLADAASWRGDELVAVETTEPFALSALAARDDRGLHVLVASLVPHPQQCRIEGLPAGPARLRVLDESSFALATSDPEAFRATWETVAVDDPFVLTLSPYATARLDVAR